MNANDLLDVIGDAKERHILDAINTRDGVPVKQKHLSLSKAFLIAAVIVLTLLLVGCTVIYVFGLRDMIITQEELSPPTASGEASHPVQIRNVISLQGYVGTPGYLANQEWNDFQESYQAPENEPEIPMDQRLDYLSYGCFFQAEIDKVDEICKKYGLNPLGIAWIEEDMETTFDALGIDGLLLPDAPASAHYAQGYYYGDGTFDISFDLTLIGSDAPWKDPLDVRMRYVKKTSFDGVALSIGPLERYTEWTYTTAQGVTVQMALSEENALMIVDRSDAFLTVWLGDISDGASTLTQEGMEAIAEVLDFLVTPQEVDVAAAQTRYDALSERLAQERAEREQALSNLGYRERIIQLAENGHDPANTVYAFLDMDGNDIEELLVGTEAYFYNIYTLDGNESKSLLWFIDSTKVYVCENGILMYADDSFDTQIYRYAKISGTSLEYQDWVKYNPENVDSPWVRVCKTCDDGTLSSVFTSEDYDLVDQPITEEEFNAVLSAYRKIDVPTTPISEFPIQ